MSAFMYGRIAWALMGATCLVVPSPARAVDAAAGDVGAGAAGAQIVETGTAGVDAGAEAFLRWAASAQRPVGIDRTDSGDPGVGPLLEMIGGAQFVTFSEATHSEAEVLRFRNALFLALARERGYRVLAIESGLSEGALLHAYVRDGSGAFETAASRGFSWGFGAFPSNRGLLQALRRHNVERPDASVALYGFDVPGSPGNTVDPARGANAAAEDALAYLGQVDEQAHEQMRSRLAGFVGLGPREAFAFYTSLDASARDRLTGTIADLVGLLERRETAYARATSSEAFAWGLRHAVGARQVDSMFRLRPPRSETVDLVEHHAYRDRAMADNIEWIRSREGLDARIMVFAARFHIAGAPVLASNWRQGGPARESITLGSHLRARHGEQVVLIGHVFGRSAACMPSSRTAATDFDGLLSKLGVRSFVLDLRQAPPAVRTWLDQVHVLDDEFSLNPARAFDVLYYNQVEPPDCQP